MKRLENVYFVAGKVVKGFGRGSKQLGIPTANLDSQVVETVKLNNGIYYGFGQLLLTNDQLFSCADSAINKSRPPIYKMVCSLGWNPHFGNTKKSLEVHLIQDFGFDFYGAELRVAICGYIRGEQKFDCLQELIDAIQNDIRIANNDLADEQTWKSVCQDKFFESDQ